MGEFLKSELTILLLKSQKRRDKRLNSWKANFSQEKPQQFLKAVINLKQVKDLPNKN